MITPARATPAEGRALIHCSNGSQYEYEESQQRVRGEVGETLESEVAETESSRGSGVYVSQSRLDGNYSALSCMMDEVLLHQTCTPRTASLWITSYRSLSFVGS